MTREFNIFKNVLVTLKSYQNEDLDSLIEVGKDEKIWEYYKIGGLTNSKDIVRYKEEERAKKNFYDFVIIDNASNKIIGYTGLFNINKEKNEAEIGATFIHSDYWGKGHNQEAKKLLIEHAFHDLGFDRLTLISNILNKRSSNAALKLGFQLEKILEKKRLNQDGTYSDFGYFILEKDKN